MSRYRDRCYAVHAVEWRRYMLKFAPYARYSSCPAGHYYRVPYSKAKDKEIERLSGIHFVLDYVQHGMGVGTQYYDKDKFELDADGFVVPKDREKYVMTHRGKWDWKADPEFVVDLPGSLNVSYPVYLRKQRGEATPPRRIPSESDYDACSESGTDEDIMADQQWAQGNAPDKGSIDFLLNPE